MDDLHEQCEKIVKKIKPGLLKVYRTLSKSDRSIEFDDICQMAYVVCLEHITNYRSFRNGKKTKMKPETYVMWKIMDTIYSEFNHNMIVSVSRNGDSIQIPYAEYKKKMGYYKAAGYSCTFTKLIQCDSDMQRENDDDFDIENSREGLDKEINNLLFCG